MFVAEDNLRDTTLAAFARRGELARAKETSSELEADSPDQKLSCPQRLQRLFPGSFHLTPGRRLQDCRSWLRNCCQAGVLFPSSKPEISWRSFLQRKAKDR